VAAALAGQLVPGDLVELRGELGAGKTTFVRGAARALGVTQVVSSPTYTVGNSYRGRVAVSHLDLYRAHGLTEEELGDLEPYLEEAVVFVEWPQAGEGMLPPARVVVDLDNRGGDARLISLSCLDPTLLEAVARTLS
jgi:tRNA threonylcarbamoyladenosine biosynthesis protein TsaE